MVAPSRTSRVLARALARWRAADATSGLGALTGTIPDLSGRTGSLASAAPTQQPTIAIHSGRTYADGNGASPGALLISPTASVLSGKSQLTIVARLLGSTTQAATKVLYRLGATSTTANRFRLQIDAGVAGQVSCIVNDTSTNQLQVIFSGVDLSAGPVVTLLLDRAGGTAANVVKLRVNGVPVTLSSSSGNAAGITGTWDATVAWYLLASTTGGGAWDGGVSSHSVWGETLSGADLAAVEAAA